MPTNTPTPVTNNQSSLSGGDLLGFGIESAPQPQTQPATSNGFDLMGFGTSTPPALTQPSQPPQPAGFGFGFGGPPQPTTTVPATSAPQNNNIGFNFGTSAPSAVQPPSQQSSGFQPITNTNPNKILGY